MPVDGGKPGHDRCSEAFTRVGNPVRAGRNRDRVVTDDDHLPTGSAASTTSPSIASAAAARIAGGRRLFASPRYGTTMVGTEEV